MNCQHVTNACKPWEQRSQKIHEIKIFSWNIKDKTLKKTARTVCAFHFCYHVSVACKNIM